MYCCSIKLIEVIQKTKFKKPKVSFTFLKNTARLSLKLNFFFNTKTQYFILGALANNFFDIAKKKAVYSARLRNTTKNLFYYFWFFKQYLNSFLKNVAVSSFSFCMKLVSLNTSSPIFNLLKSPNRFKGARDQLSILTKRICMHITCSLLFVNNLENLVLFDLLSFFFFKNFFYFFFFESNFGYLTSVHHYIKLPKFIKI